MATRVPSGDRARLELQRHIRYHLVDMAHLPIGVGKTPHDGK